MASDLPDLHDRALAGTHRYVAGVGGDQWKTSSPCEGWDVRELVNHIVSGNFWAGELARGKTIDEVGDRLDGDILGDDPTAAYDFESNVGYPAPVHKSALAWYGPSAIHRRSWIFMDGLCWRGVPPAPGRLF